VADERLVEIVPNFSEGRRREVIDAILGAVAVPGVIMLSRQWDADHNRLDCTLVGSPEAVRASALAGAAKAEELIDMRRHRGGHPRMGAVDVIPFVPVRGVDMQDCIDLARETGRQIADTLGIPVYLYDRAALIPERASLAEVRKGEYEGLRDDVAEGRRLPDFGPHEIGAAGAVAVGARKALIAFNVYLDGTDVAAAKDIARQVRESSGGLPAVRAIGFLAEERGVVTVSMNLVDFEVTGLRAAFDAVSTLAASAGMPVTDSEIVGLVPRAALDPAGVSHLKLEGFDEDEQILESVMSRAEARARTPAAPPIAGGSGGGIRDRTVGGFLEALASDAPTPGGGSVAAVCAAVGAALIAMVGRLTAGRPGYEAVQDEMAEMVRDADRARDDLLELADRDARAFDAVMAAFRQPKETDEERAERSAAIQRAFLEAARVPMEVARAALALMAKARVAVERGNESAASDAASAASALFAAVQSALANVEINVGSLKDLEEAARLRTSAAEIDDASRSELQSVLTAFRRRIEAGSS
jgi:glutamate formiminotransferase/formiminotetrahydrofolate cyclodeaminase